MVPIWSAVEFQATALPNSSGGTRLGTSAWLRRICEGPRRTESEDEEIDRPEASRPVSDVRQKAERDESHGRVGQDQDPAAVVAVGDEARHQDEGCGRGERGESDETESQGVLADIVDAPRQGDVLHLHGKRHAKPCGAEQAKVAVPEGGPAACAHSLTPPLSWFGPAMVREAQPDFGGHNVRERLDAVNDTFAVRFRRSRR